MIITILCYFLPMKIRFFFFFFCVLLPSYLTYGLSLFTISIISILDISSIINYYTKKMLHRKTM